MLFNSYFFIFAFLPVVLTLYAWVRRHSDRGWTISLLIIASLFYYAWWKPEFLLVLLLSISANAVFGKLLCNATLSPKLARAVLVVGIIFNLGLLGYFKYTIFIVDNINEWFSLGLDLPEIILPIGISFITFQQIAFLIDSHRGLVRSFSIQNYTLFITFFPQLIAGPIVHHSETMPQFDRRPSVDEFRVDLAIGLSFFIVGLFKKVVIADSIALYADAGYGALRGGQTLDFMSAWITVISYSLQLYFDFSGYSDMAVGLARMFGIRLPVNFHSPYKAASIIEFWRCWHMTLSRFLRDYLYIPLGGNRVAKLHQFINVSIVMLLGGLWHGANWTFVVWGGIHGIFLAINHAWKCVHISHWRLFNGTAMRVFFIALTFTAVTLAWVPFRADNIADAKRMFSLLFPTNDIGAVESSLKHFLAAQTAVFKNAADFAQWFKPRELWPNPLPGDFIAGQKPVGLLLIIALSITFLLPNTQQLFSRYEPVTGLTVDQLRHRWALHSLGKGAAVVISGMFILAVLQFSRVSPFLYFQF
jgi:alginate O-acetyltransferase complex protein AlgI